MLGTTRFILAMLVLYSHSSNPGTSINLGVISVVVFYFISGCLMRKSFMRFVNNSSTPVISFYKDRVLKLFPQYAIVLIATFILVGIFGPSDHVLFMNQPFGWERFLLNITLLPANYVFEPLAIDGLLPHPVIPPAWSLSSEFHFYLILPLLVAFSRYQFFIVFVFVLLIQISSLFFSSENFNSDNFGYRYIFGSLIFFLLGYCYAFRESSFYRKLLIGGWSIYFIALVVVAPFAGIFSHRFVPELLIGVMISLPLVHAALYQRVGDQKKSSIDIYLGQLAYPVFITHFLALYLCEKLFGLVDYKQPLYYPVVVVMTLLIAIVLKNVQIALDGIRFKARGFPSALA